MKAIVVSETGYDGGQLMAGRFFSRTVRRLVVKEKDLLAITVHNNEVFAMQNFKIDDDCKIIGEVEVPDELVEKALAFVRAKTELDALKDTFKVFIGS